MIRLFVAKIFSKPRFDRIEVLPHGGAMSFNFGGIAFIVMNKSDKSIYLSGIVKKKGEK